MGSSEKNQISDFTELKPYGITFGMDPNKPLFIFKDLTETKVLSLPLSPLEAGIVLSQLNSAVTNSPHLWTEAAFKTFGLRISRSVFLGYMETQQWMRVEMEIDGKAEDQSLQVNRFQFEGPVQEWLSLSLFHKAKFWISLEVLSGLISKASEIEAKDFFVKQVSILDGRPPRGYLN